MLVSGVCVSYRPMLSHLEALLFGDPKQAFTRDSMGRETHVDRTLNVIGSGFQHKRFFSAMTQQVVSILSSLSPAQRPRFIVDTGCGEMKCSY